MGEVGFEIIELEMMNWKEGEGDWVCLVLSLVRYAGPDERWWWFEGEGEVNGVRVV